jgi:hypothetical protein
MKNTPSFLVLTGLGALPFLRNRGSLAPWQWVPGVFFFAAMLPAINVGVRQLLPAYPFFVMVAAVGAERLWLAASGTEGRRFRLLAGTLLGLHALSALAAWPGHLSYFNDLIPGRYRWQCLGESCVDIGQDMKRLAQVARERGWRSPRVALFLCVNPSLYGMHWDPWSEGDVAGPQNGRVYVVNAAFLQLGAGFHPEWTPVANGWIRHIQPTGRIGGSLIYYEAPGEAHPDRTPWIQTVAGVYRAP